LPDPAPAKTSADSRGKVTARSCSGFRYCNSRGETVEASGTSEDIEDHSKRGGSFIGVA